MNQTTLCPVCGSDVKEWKQRYREAAGDWYDCPNCGSYILTVRAQGCLGSLDERGKAALSHGIWRGQRGSEPFMVTEKVVDAVIKEPLPLPDPIAQLDLYVQYLGDQTANAPGENWFIDSGNLRAKIGAVTTVDADYIDHCATKARLLAGHDIRGKSGGRLTIKGWQRYQELQRGTAASRTAFMAMPFRENGVVTMVNDYFRKAVEDTGFTLKRVDDDPKAGLIDDKIRVDIRLSRFVIADLTDCNPGAYWEAGYAEGLGKPVIYTCRKDCFEKGTHFDTNHHTTVPWDPDSPGAACEQLKATIRATLPFEAKMSDE